MAMIANRKITRAARRLFRLCLVDGVLNERRVREVARRLASSGRRGSIQTLARFQRLVRLDRDRHTARVESAAPLSDRVRESIQADLARLYGRTVETSFSENPALIGGMRIRIGSDVYDDSVRARLAALEARL
jgi:F-type H+-transporting ATPase subunit delta